MNMINISLFKFGTKALEVVIIDNAPWFNASQVAKALGYTNPSEAIQDNVSLEYRQQLDLKRRGKKPVFISREGLEMLIANSKMLKARKFAAQLDFKVKTLSCEQNYIGIIASALQKFNPVYQFFVNGYRIDIYFPHHRIAVECDEYGHFDRDERAELARQDAIIKALGCYFIRFNPHQNGFNIGDIIHEILVAIDQKRSHLL